ncbi:MAG: tRNA epoxyqueuosine(34) reductase QueG [Ferruginibacter sp.]|nr:tRNA epoxyqueuosine(34) reductase QueG [Ferruginibacter sp.]
MLKKDQYNSFIRDVAQQLGFDYCGFSEAGFMEEDARRLESWLNAKMQGTMDYMDNHFDKRVNPSLLVPGAQSVITLLMNYYPDEVQDSVTPKISKYAYGTDYHLVIKEKLNQLLQQIRLNIGAVEGRGFVDSAPVLERSWAVRSGLGWVGKNGNLLTKKSGSFFFIATLITDLNITPDAPFSTDHCGTCTKCIDACPTQAILPDKVIDGSKCISYFTIELKEAVIPETYRGHFQDWMFGCDVCQDVCPWNRFAAPHREPAFTPIPEILHFTKADWQGLEEDAFREIFKHSPLKRTKYKNIQRNLQFIQTEKKG